MTFKPFIRGIKRLIISVIKNDFFGMAAEMGFMLVIGIFPFMLFLMAIYITLIVLVSVYSIPSKV